MHAQFENFPQTGTGFRLTCNIDRLCRASPMTHILQQLLLDGTYSLLKSDFSKLLMIFNVDEMSAKLLWYKNSLFDITIMLYEWKMKKKTSGINAAPTLFVIHLFLLIYC